MLKTDRTTGPIFVGTSVLELIDRTCGQLPRDQEQMEPNLVENVSLQKLTKFRVTASEFDRE